MIGDRKRIIKKNILSKEGTKKVFYKIFVAQSHNRVVLLFAGVLCLLMKEL